MTISIWRYSHLVLAILSSVFLLIASITGAVLAVEPIHNNTFSYHIKNSDDLPLSRVMSVVKNKYEEVLSLKRDKNGFVILEVIPEEGSSSFYIDPFTGEKIGELIEQHPIFEFMTGLHRSLFLQSLGRGFIGTTAFILFFIAISGVVLILKRQNSIKGFFSKIVKENTSQYFHIIFGRLTLIPIVILSLTGAYLSLQRFKIIPKENIALEIPEDAAEMTVQLDFENMHLFTKTTLSNFRGLLFPLFEDAEEYYHLKAVDSEYYINQFNGEVVSEYAYPFTTVLSTLSFDLHTGAGTIVWAFILGVTSLSMPYFMYSGFVMTINRRKGRIKNVFKKDKSEYVLLIGSENGSTRIFAKMLHEGLLKSGKSSYIADLNGYTSFKEMKYMIVLASTYGQGEAPVNASKFLKIYKEAKNGGNPFHYAVVGFGSLSYPDFCKFAYEVDECLVNDVNATRLLDVHTVNNKSFESFSNWVNQWSEKRGITIALPKEVVVKSKSVSDYKTIQKTEAKDSPDETFLVELQSLKKQSFTSGDLLAVYPEGSNQERLYSIGILKNTILLSVKKHEFGLCSNYLNNLKLEETLEGYIIKNKEFHYPHKAKKVVLIATGTGIAPFLGMIENNAKKRNTSLYWGAKNKESFVLYQDIINDGIENDRLTQFNPAYSREGTEKVYVQHLIERDHVEIVNTLDSKGVIMICGSVAMQKEIMEILGKYCLKRSNKPLSYYKNRNQIRIDCY
ncbi:MAG: PepSY domain-containing protein [Cellulophaga sp.]